MTPDSDGLFWGHQVSESGTVYGSTNAAMAVPVPLALKSVCSGCTKFSRCAFASRTQQITFQKMHQINNWIFIFLSVCLKELFPKLVSELINGQLASWVSNHLSIRWELWHCRRCKLLTTGLWIPQCSGREAQICWHKLQLWILEGSGYSKCYGAGRSFVQDKSSHEVSCHWFVFLMQIIWACKIHKETSVILK